MNKELVRDHLLLARWYDNDLFLLRGKRGKMAGNEQLIGIRLWLGTLVVVEVASSSRFLIS
jgi:hypothetical protein